MFSKFKIQTTVKENLKLAIIDRFVQMITMIIRRKVLCSSFEGRIVLFTLFSLTGVLHISSLLSQFALVEYSTDLNLLGLPSTFANVTIGNNSKAGQALHSSNLTRKSIQSNVVTDAMNTPDPCFGKEQLVAMIRTASLQAEDRAAKVRITDKLCQDLPTWDEVTRLYGEEPDIIGLERCQEYRDRLSEGNLQPKPRVAGLFNTGTNAMARSLRMNLKFLSFRVPYEVPWGKHVPAPYKSNNTYPANNRDSKEHVLPIVMVRDPFRWLISMCKQGYEANWTYIPSHCPNLVTSAEDRKHEVFHNVTKFEVTVKWSQSVDTLVDTYDSLADLWSQWYRQYLEADYPRIFVRFEDMLFHPSKVMDAISQCVNATPIHKDYQYYLYPSKRHGFSADFVGALIKYGREEGRYGNLTADDLGYAKRALDADMMRMMQYSYPPDSHIPPNPVYGEPAERPVKRRKAKDKGTKVNIRMPPPSIQVRGAPKPLL